MTKHPEWHGFTSCKPGGVLNYYSNYMSAYIYFIEIASAVSKGISAETVNPTVYITEKVKNGIKDYFYNGGIKSKDGNKLSWDTLLSGNTIKNPNKDKALFIYGLALHTATDMYAHSSYTESGSYINHDMGADKEEVYENRILCADEMARQLIAHIKRFEAGKLSDYYKVANSIYNGTFYLGSFSSYAEEIDSSYYNANKTVFDRMDLKRH